MVNHNETYAQLHRLASLPVGNPKREKALKILGMLEKGEKEFKEENPDQDEVVF